LSHTWSLDIANNASTRIVHEFDADLGDTSSRAWLEVVSECHDERAIQGGAGKKRRTCAAEDSGDFDKLNRDFAGVHVGW